MFILEEENKKITTQYEYDYISKSENINEYAKLQSVVGEGGRMKRRGGRGRGRGR